MKEVAVLALAMVGVTACAETPPTACTAEARPGLSVTVRDAVTGLAVNDSVLVIARDGAYADTARGALLANGVYSLVYERAGRYEVTVAHAGYALWRRAGVEVTAGACHVVTVQLLALLQRTQ